MNFNISIFFFIVISSGWILILILSNSILFDIKIFAVSMICFKFTELAIKLKENDE